MYRFDLLQLGFFFSTYEKDFFFFSFGKQGLIIVKYRLERIRRFSFCLINLVELIKCGIYFKRFLFKINIINILDRGFQESSILEIQYNSIKIVITSHSCCIIFLFHGTILPLSLISNVISFLHCTFLYIPGQQWATQQKAVEIHC